MRKLWRVFGIFWIVAGTGVGIAGGYWAALAVGAIVWFWVVIALALLAAIVFRVGPSLVSAAQKLQNYQRLVERVASLESDLKAESESSTALAADGIEARAEGIAEGERRIIGALLAREEKPPVLVGIAEVANEVVLIAERGEHPALIGSRYLLRSTNTAQVWGVVELQAWDVDDHGILRCVEATSQKYWDALAIRVVESDAAPSDVVLEPSTLAFDPKPQIEITLATPDSESTEG